MVSSQQLQLGPRGQWAKAFVAWQGLGLASSCSLGEGETRTSQLGPVPPGSDFDLVAQSCVGWTASSWKSLWVGQALRMHTADSCYVIRNVTTFKNNLSGFRKLPMGWHFHTRSQSAPTGGFRRNTHNFRDRDLTRSSKQPWSLVLGVPVFSLGRPRQRPL